MCDFPASSRCKLITSSGLDPFHLFVKSRTCLGVRTDSVVILSVSRTLKKKCNQIYFINFFFFYCRDSMLYQNLRKKLLFFFQYLIDICKLCYKITLFIIILRYKYSVNVFYKIKIIIC